MNEDEFKIAGVRIYIEGVGWAVLQQFDNCPLTECDDIAR